MRCWKLPRTTLGFGTLSWGILSDPGPSYSHLWKCEFVLESLICCPSWLQIQNPPALNWGLILQAYGTMPCLFFYICFLNRNHWEILGMGALRTYPPSLMLFTPGMLCSPLLQAQGIDFLCLLFPSQVSNTAWCSFVRGAGHLLSRHFGIDFTVAED